MKFLRAIGIGALFWILIFIEISITMIGLKLSDSIVYIIHYIFMIPLIIFCARLYYKSKDKTNGFLLGLFIVVVGIILDMIITVPLFIVPAGGSYASYLSNTYLITGFIEGILVTGIYGLAKRR